jgi:hypothetical protein
LLSRKEKEGENFEIGNRERHQIEEGRKRKYTYRDDRHTDGNYRKSY